MSAPGLLHADWDLPEHAKDAIKAFAVMLGTNDPELIDLAKRNMDNRMAIVTRHAMADTWWRCEVNARRKRYQKQWFIVCDTVALCILLLSVAVYVWKQLPN